MDKALDQAKERLQIGSNERGGLIDLYPTAPAQTGFQPVVEHNVYMHQVDLNLILLIGPREAVAAKRLSLQIADEACFFLRLSNGCVPRSLAVIEGTFGDDPPLTTRSRDQSDFDTVVADAKGDDCCLAI